MMAFLNDSVDFLSDAWWDQITLGIISWIQQYGVIITIVLVILGLFGRLLAKMAKHTPAQKFFLNFAAGMGFITLVFIFVPYLFLYYRSSSACDQLIAGDWKGFISASIALLQKLSILITVLVVIMSFIYHQLASIRSNPRLKQSYLVRAVGITLVCLVFQILPEIVQSFMK